MSLFKKKYSLHLCPDFTSAKKSYHAGERVKVCYNLIATDTDYSFSSPDVEMKQGYDDKHGYTFDFIMPERDVTINVSHQNSMVPAVPDDAEVEIALPPVESVREDEKGR